MAKIVIQKDTGLSSEELRDKLKAMLSRIRAKWFRDRDMTYEWTEDEHVLNFAGKNYDGVVEIGEGYVKIAVNLSWTLSLVAEDIDRTIEEELDEALSE